MYKKCLSAEVNLLLSPVRHVDPATEVNLRMMVDMRKRFNYPVGLSDHSEGTGAAVCAAALGACMIEKLFTLSRRSKSVDTTWLWTGAAKF
jgi:sialic acid synthase SpsE